MKKPAFIFYTDAHVKTGNEEECILSVEHMVKYALENNIDTVVFGGDMFHSRSNQKESVLRAVDRMFTLISNAKLRHILIFGNHDSTSYFDHNSFLDVYRYHPNSTLITHITDMNINGIDVTLLPFFDDSMLVPMLEAHEGGDMLLSHFEMKGSTHLGKVSEKGTITRKTLSKWNKTYLGHFHSTHEITPNIVHLPSLRQNDFGEDNNKGFSVIYDDGSYEIIKGVFKEFKKIIIDVETVSTNDIKKLIEEHRDSKDTVRFEFKGSEQKLKSLDKGLFGGTAIDVKMNYEKKFNFDSNEEAPKLIKKFDIDNIEKAFESFCKDKDLDYEKGKELLDNFLKKKKSA